MATRDPITTVPTRPVSVLTIHPDGQHTTARIALTTDTLRQRLAGDVELVAGGAQYRAYRNANAGRDGLAFNATVDDALHRLGHRTPGAYVCGPVAFVGPLTGDGKHTDLPVGLARILTALADAHRRRSGHAIAVQPRGTADPGCPVAAA
jgi:hypothetical protein